MGEIYKLKYFKSKGNAEIIRMVFSAAGQKFEDERMDREQWLKIKPDSPFGGMPILSITKGKTETSYCQTGAIARTLARKFKLAGANEEEQLLVEEVFECVMDTQKAIIGLFSDKNDDAAKAAIKDEFVKESIPKLAKYVELRSGKGKNGYIVGSALSLADLAVFNFVDQTGGLGLVDAWNKYPVIKKHQEKVKSEKKVAEWLKKRQEYEQK